MAHSVVRRGGGLYADLLIGAAVAVVGAGLLSPQQLRCPVRDLAHANIIPPQCVDAELAPKSQAVVPIARNNLTIDLPRNVLGGMFVGPIYCPSGRGVCGQLFSPRIAVLWPSFAPIPAARAAEFRVLSAARHPDLIYAVLLGNDEPARVAAFLGGLKAEDVSHLVPASYGLYRLLPNVPSIVVTNPGTRDRVALDLPISGRLDATEQVNGQKYVLGDVHFAFQFNASLLPHWSEINDRLTKLIESSVQP